MDIFRYMASKLKENAMKSNISHDLKEKTINAPVIHLHRTKLYNTPGIMFTMNQYQIIALENR